MEQLACACYRVRQKRLPDNDMTWQSLYILYKYITHFWALFTCVRSEKRKSNKTLKGFVAACQRFDTLTDIWCFSDCSYANYIEMCPVLKRDFGCFVISIYRNILIYFKNINKWNYQYIRICQQQYLFIKISSYLIQSIY